jgi:hypothetical protein
MREERGQDKVATERDGGGRRSNGSIVRERKSKME